MKNGRPDVSRCPDQILFRLELRPGTNSSGENLAIVRVCVTMRRAIRSDCTATSRSASVER